MLMRPIAREERRDKGPEKVVGWCENQSTGVRTVFDRRVDAVGLWKKKRTSIKKFVGLVTEVGGIYI